MTFLKRLFKNNKLPVTKHPVKLAFIIDGVDYYQFEDFNNIPAMRGLKTMVFYEEVRMKCTPEYLNLHCQAIDEILGKDKIDIFNIKKLNDQMKQRLDMALDTDLVYKLATVVFFDLKENIEDYDFDYNRKKADVFRKHPSFFLLKPLQELLPVLTHIDENLEKYSQVVNQLNQVHLETLLQNLPAKQTQTLKGKSYFSVVAMPAKLKV